MPFKSKAQRRKFAALLVEGKIKPETFEEWNRETGGSKLPERVSGKGSKKAKEQPKKASKKPKDRPKKPKKASTRKARN